MEETTPSKCPHPAVELRRSLDACYGRGIAFCQIYVPGNDGPPLLKTRAIRWVRATFFLRFPTLELKICDILNEDAEIKKKLLYIDPMKIPRPRYTTKKHEKKMGPFPTVVSSKEPRHPENISETKVVVNLSYVACAPRSNYSSKNYLCLANKCEYFFSVATGLVVGYSVLDLLM